MKQYRFDFSEEQYGYVYFSAESLTEAESLLEQIQNYDINPEDLPNALIKHKSGQCEYDNLEELKD
jgi:hypothetical protein